MGTLLLEEEDLQRQKEQLEDMGNNAAAVGVGTINLELKRIAYEKRQNEELTKLNNAKYILQQKIKKQHEEKQTRFYDKETEEEKAIRIEEEIQFAKEEEEYTT